MPKKILVVDDDPHMVQLVRTNLEEAGYIVVTSSNGKEGLQAVNEHLPDLIVLNDKMPTMDGFEMMRLLKACSVMQEIPVIMLLDDTSDTQVFASWHAGADCSVCKPFNPVELLAYIKRIFTSLEASDESKDDDPF